MCILLYCCFLYEHREGQCLSLVMCSVVMYCCIVVLLLFYVNIMKLIYSWCDCPTIFGVGERCVLPTLKLSVIFPLNMVGVWRQTCHTIFGVKFPLFFLQCIASCHVLVLVLILLCLCMVIGLY